MNRVLILLMCGVGLVGCEKTPETAQSPNPSSPAVSTPDGSSAPATQPDNTGINTRDQVQGAVTAGAQGEAKSDVDITAEIRRRIMGANLSVNAQNAKIVTQNGKVTLRGPVNDQNEVDSIGRMATDVAGTGNVDNQLEIKPNG